MSVGESVTEEVQILGVRGEGQKYRENEAAWNWQKEEMKRDSSWRWE